MQSKSFLVLALILVLTLLNTVPAASDNEKAITSRVHDRLVKDSHLKDANVRVDTNRRGEVTLTGTVLSRADKDRATELARSVEGVKSVDNDLKVETESYSTRPSSSKYGTRENPPCPIGANWC